MAITGDPAGPPTLIGESIADVVSGLFASWAMLAAMVERTRTRSGRRIDVAMFDSMMALQPLVVARYLATSEAPMRVGNRHALSPTFGAFAANDGEFVLAVLASEMAARVTDKRLQIHGGYGFTRDFPLERYVRDVRIMRICEGSSEVQRNIIARGLAGLTYAKFSAPTIIERRPGRTALARRRKSSFHRLAPVLTISTGVSAWRKSRIREPSLFLPASIARSPFSRVMACA